MYSPLSRILLELLADVLDIGSMKSIPRHIMLVALCICEEILSYTQKVRSAFNTEVMLSRLIVLERQPPRDCRIATCGSSGRALRGRGRSASWNAMLGAICAARPGTLSNKSVLLELTPI
jgi:hypothetical protein